MWYYLHRGRGEQDVKLERGESGLAQFGRLNNDQCSCCPPQEFSIAATREAHRTGSGEKFPVANCKAVGQEGAGAGGRGKRSTMEVEVVMPCRDAQDTKMLQ